MLPRNQAIPAGVGLLVMPCRTVKKIPIASQLAAGWAPLLDRYRCGRESLREEGGFCRIGLTGKSG
jgi:hypothetical protein